jgi:hypothetical protein
MAVEKAALDITSCGMEAHRAALNKSVSDLTEMLEATPKPTSRRRIKEKAKDLDLSFLEGTIEL